MIQCGHCGIYNKDSATECSKCGARLARIPRPPTQTHRVGPVKSKVIRDKALTAIVIGLLLKVYWGGYGPWPVIDIPVLSSIRPWLEPLLLYGGVVGYVVGWVLSWV
jgi:hypothetical protein